MSTARVWSCVSGCGAEHISMDAQVMAPPGWSYLEILRGYRCPQCHRDLTAASSMPGAEPQPFVDTIPSVSRGALPKETAHTILPPSVKG